MPPKKTPAKGTPSSARVASPRRRRTAASLTSSGGNVGVAAERHFAEIMQECVQSAQRLTETSQSCTVRHQREVKKILALLNEAHEKRPVLLRSGRSPGRGSGAKS